MNKRDFFLIFVKRYAIYETFTAEMMCKRLKISRPTASKLIDNLIIRNIIIPFHKAADKRKWFKVVQ